MAHDIYITILTDMYNARVREISSDIFRLCVGAHQKVQLEMQKSICEANFAWIFACYWNGVNSNFHWHFSRHWSILTVEKLE